MKNLILQILFFNCCFLTIANGQMEINGKTYAGNEWINYDQTYYKIKIGSDGIYRIKGNTLISMGIDIKNTSPNRYQLWHGGQEQPLLVSTVINFGNEDYIEFYGTKHRIQMDTFLYKNWRQELLNTEFSLCNDTSTYFLTIVPNGTNTLRVKKIEPNYNNITLNELEGYLHTEKLFYNKVFYSPIFDGTNKIKYSNFVGLEGFSFGPTELCNVDINTSNIENTSNITPFLRLRFGLNNSANTTEIYFNGNLIGSKTVNNQIYVEDTIINFNLSELKNSNTIQLKNVGLGEDRNLLSVIELSYPRKFIFDTDKNAFINLKKGKNYFSFTGINSNDTENVYCYSTKSNQRVKYNLKDNVKKLFVENSEDESAVLYTDKNVNIITNLEKKIFNKFTQFESNYMFITARKFEKISGVRESIENYISYRTSLKGGNYRSSKVYVEDIYDEFGWGNENHLQAFKNFTYFLKTNNTKNRYICLLGKGREYLSWRNYNNPDVDNKTLFIPTYGEYPSDELLFTQGNESYSNFQIGRIAAENSEDINNYLSKVEEFENVDNINPSIENIFWRKKIMHLSGGGTAGEQISIKNHLNNMKTIIEKPNFGGDVMTFYKTTTDPIDEAISLKIRRLINSGISYMTFFGHSGVGTWDINVEDPELWDNKGKYPIITSLGCFSGNIHTQYRSIGEKFVFIKDKGGIAYLASSGSALLDLQGIFGKDMYNFLAKEAYGTTIGDLIGLLKLKYKSNVDRGTLTLNQQLTLLGDPALKLYGNSNPDYTSDPKSLHTNPTIIGSGDKKFDVILDIYNLGKYIEDSLDIRVIFQSIDKNDIDTIFYKISCPASKSNIKLTIPNKGIVALGKNKIFITLDPFNKIKENPDPDAEQNNELVYENGDIGYEFYILDNTARPVYPTEFSIVNKRPIFRIATSNAFATEAKYIIQIDTTELFNSPSLYNGNILSTGGTFSFDSNINFTNNTVYYWRVSPDSINPAIGYSWQNSSFIFLEDSPEGWNQSHYFQYKKNPFNFIYINEDRNFAFSNRLRNVEIVNGKYVQDFIGYKVDFNNPAASVRPWTFLDGGIGIALINPLDAVFKDNDPKGSFGSIKTDAFGSVRCFAFQTKTKEDRKKIIDMLNNNVPDGYFVTLFSVYSTINADLNTNEWAADSLLYGENLFNALEKRGAKDVRKLLGSKILPYSFIYKNNEGPIAEDIGKDFNAVINTKLEFPYAGTSGEHLSVPIGPVKAWKNVIWNTINPELKDTINISILGVKADGQIDVLFEKINNKNIDISNIDVSIYPIIKLKYNCVDLVNRTVPSLIYWRVLADPLPDIEISPAIAYEIPDSVQQGQPFSFKIGIANASKTRMDSLLVKSSISGQSSDIILERIMPFESGQNIAYKGSIETNKLIGNYIFSLELNPNDDQMESIKYNNIGIKSIKVKPDKTNPLLNVTFDAITILNKDIVSPNPLIKIELKDENKYLLLQDDENLEVSLQYPDLHVEKISKEKPTYKFYKATSSENNTAFIEYSPTLSDGEYLLTVRGKDASGNYSGNLNYEVLFNVITKQSISNVLNYPNPFSNSTKFIFTITGKVPNSARIKIMTISGKVVKEITEAEIGTLKIGQNMTQYAWDGTDDFGNKLANGVYLYKVIFKSNEGSNVDLLENKSIDKYFHNGFGKLVIVR